MHPHPEPTPPASPLPRPSPDRRAILVAAWAVARTLAAGSGRPARAHLAKAQRTAWATAREASTFHPAPCAPAQPAAVAAIGADDVVETAVASCLAIGESIALAVQVLARTDRAAARSLSLLGAAVELAALDCRDRGSGPPLASTRHAGSGRLH